MYNITEKDCYGEKSKLIRIVFVFILFKDVNSSVKGPLFD